MNPYLHPVWSQWLREGHHGGARTLQYLVLALYNGRAWPVDIGQVCRLSDAHSDAALSLRMDDGIPGGQNEHFMAQCREMATTWLGQPQTDGG